MLTAQRYLIIRKALQERRIMTVREASLLTQASEATTRRDFSEMEGQGFLHRVHGGAELLRSDSSVPLASRRGMQELEKRAIARVAASYCTDGDTVMIDGGSTTQAMIGYLGDTSLSVVTNSFEIAQELYSRPGKRVYVLGGEVDRESGIIRSPFQEDVLGGYRADTVFMGVGGIDGNGATNDDEHLIRVERAMINQAKRVIVLADATKFAKRGTLFLCKLSEIDIIITDDNINASTQEMLHRSGVEVVVAKEGKP